MKKTKAKMNKPAYIGLSILEINNILIYEFWYDYIQRKCQNNAKLCYMDNDSFVVQIKAGYFYKDVADDVKNQYDTSNYEVDRPLPKRMNKIVLRVIEDELGGNTRKEYVAFRPKTYSYLTDDDKNVKKAKETDKCVIKRILKFNYYKDYLFKNEIILKSQQKFKSEGHCAYIKLTDKITGSINNDNWLQTFGRIRTYPYGKNAFKVCKSDMINKYKWSVLIVILT